MSHSPPHLPLPGILLHSPRAYDLQVWLATRGRERSLRETILNLARPRPGEAVLDVGCGTGTLAIATRPRVGPDGEVVGADPSAEMLAGARRKARRSGVEVSFVQAPAQALPFPERRFDLVMSTLMLHHLPRPARGEALREIRRVLKPGGRLLVVDFASSSKQQGGLLHRLHHHGRVKPAEILELVTGAGLERLDAGALSVRDLYYVLAVAPGAEA
ncbi:MAG: methyltransferase domain-containing protein [Caulobacterales bacterium]|nr:methyltransferase domain-containing protein [Caulobacterales bacterium]